MELRAPEHRAQRFVGGGETTSLSRARGWITLALADGQRPVRSRVGGCGDGPSWIGEWKCGARAQDAAAGSRVARVRVGAVDRKTHKAVDRSRAALKFRVGPLRGREGGGGRRRQVLSQVSVGSELSHMPSSHSIPVHGIADLVELCVALEGHLLLRWPPFTPPLRRSRVAPPPRPVCSTPF